MDFRDALRQPFPENFGAILRAHVPFQGRLGEAERSVFEQKLKVFVHTKDFVGVDGMVIDETVRVIIAATACRLSLHMPGEHYGRLRTIFVFPSLVPTSSGGSIQGQARTHDVELSWEDLLHGLRIEDDGENVGYHEFAHVLDKSHGGLYARWYRALDAVTDRPVVDSTLEPAGANPDVEDLFPQGVTANPVELFAYATEIFFEKPRVLLETHPELYRTLSGFYFQDPAGR